MSVENGGPFVIPNYIGWFLVLVIALGIGALIIPDIVLLGGIVILYFSVVWMFINSDRGQKDHLQLLVKGLGGLALPILVNVAVKAVGLFLAYLNFFPPERAKRLMSMSNHLTQQLLGLFFVGYLLLLVFLYLQRDSRK